MEKVVYLTAGDDEILAFFSCLPMLIVLCCGQAWGR